MKTQNTGKDRALKTPGPTDPEPLSAVSQIITDRLIAALEAGVIPWRRPWSRIDTAPANLVTGRRYTSWLSLMMLALRQMIQPFKSPFWLTGGQVLKLGGEVLKGENPTPVVSIWWVRVGEETGKPRSVPKSRCFWVFNYEQCQNLKKTPPVPEIFAHDPIAAAEALVAAMPDPPAICERGDRAAYDPALDMVLMPGPEHFKRRAAYYEVLFHELAHSTAHRKRLNRALPGPHGGIWDGQEAHAREELIAEMTSAFLCGQAGIFDQVAETSAAYLEGWLKVLRGDHRLVVTAAAQAQKAADYILGRQPGLGPWTHADGRWAGTRLIGRSRKASGIRVFLSRIGREARTAADCLSREAFVGGVSGTS